MQILRGSKLLLNWTKITNIRTKLNIKHWLWPNTLDWHVDIKKNENKKLKKFIKNYKNK